MSYKCSECGCNLDTRQLDGETWEAWCSNGCGEGPSGDMECVSTGDTRDEAADLHHFALCDWRARCEIVERGRLEGAQEDRYDY
jgi:hypothetical protein